MIVNTRHPGCFLAKLAEESALQLVGESFEVFPGANRAADLPPLEMKILRSTAEGVPIRPNVSASVPAPTLRNQMREEKERIRDSLKLPIYFTFPSIMFFLHPSDSIFGKVAARIKQKVTSVLGDIHCNVKFNGSQVGNETNSAVAYLILPEVLIEDPWQLHTKTCMKELKLIDVGDLFEPPRYSTYISARISQKFLTRWGLSQCCFRMPPSH